MKKSKFSEEQIATALRQIDAGAPVLVYAPRNCRQSKGELSDTTTLAPEAWLE